MCYAIQHHEDTISNGLKLDEYFEKLCFSSPAFHYAIKNHGQCSIREFIKKMIITQKNGYQECDDLWSIVYDYVKKLLGDDTACETIEALKNDKIALTANHHGVDYFAQSVQGSMLFSMFFKEKLLKSKIIPIIACGNISLNNLTYPRGILIYNLEENSFNQIPQKLSIFPDREKTKTVCAVPSITKEYLNNAIKKCNVLKKDKVISSKLYDTLIYILQQHYMDPIVLDQKTYSEQAVLLNFKLWKQLFKGNLQDHKLVYLELEEIASRLIEQDLFNQSSLLYITLFDPLIRQGIIDGLNCKKACWENKILENRCSIKFDKQIKNSQNGNCGTHFFWGIDKNQRRISFILNIDGNDKPSLVGINENNQPVHIPFEAEILREKLKKKEIIPSLFLSYLCISFARGITCVGGYYQSEYLPVMKEKLIECLTSQNSYKKIITEIRGIETKNYLSGMQTIMIMNADRCIIPAGLVELIASGGVNEQDMENISKINFVDAHKASMLDTLTDLKIEMNGDRNWKRMISQQNYLQLKDNLVIRDKI